MTDFGLVCAVRAGDREAFRFLVLRYGRAVLAIIRSFGFGAADADEIGQEVFARAFAALDSFAGTESGSEFSAWLFSIARNSSTNERARAWRKRERGTSCGEGVERAYLGLAEVRADFDPERRLEGRQSGDELRAALSKLPGEFRRAVELSFMQEIPLQEIAAIERCSPGTVKSRISRGKERLRQILRRREAYKGSPS